MNSTLNPPIDLWSYTQDAESPNDQLTFAIDNTPSPSAGVSLQSNRYIHAAPAADWTGQTSVVVRVTDPEGLSATSGFNITVTNRKTWTGSTNNNWHTASNWSPPGVPTAKASVIIPETSNQPIVVGAPAAAEDLTIQPGAMLDLGIQELTVETTLTNEGALQSTLVVTEGMQTDFLRIYNQDGTKTSYYGVSITPSTISTGTVTAAVSTTTEATVAVLGNQLCPGRFAGVGRCYEIGTANPMSATVRFYFTAAEQKGIPLNALVLFNYNNVWSQTPGPFTSGGSGNALYVQTQNLTYFSWFALGREEAGLLFIPVVRKGANKLYLPLAVK
jgi:hypothetical protein